MRILYDSSSGKIFYAVYDKDWFCFVHTTNIPLTELLIDEVGLSNKNLCFDLSQVVNKKDALGAGKYYISAGVLYEKVGWVEFLPIGIS